MRHFILSITLITHTTTALAGERGFYIVGIDIGTDKFWKSKYYESWKKTKENINEAYWKKRGSGIEKLGYIYIRNTPEGINIELANKIVAGDKTAKNKTKEILRKYSDNNIGSGFDGMYITKLDGNVLTIYGFGARSGRIAVKKDFVFDQKNLEQSAIKFDKKLCEVSAPFDDGFSP